MTTEEYKRNLVRMLDSLRTKYKGENCCTGVICTEQEPIKDEVILTKKEYRELVLSEFDNGYAKGYSEALAETLKHEPVLDKIRAEIAGLHLIGYATTGDGKRELASKAVMQIIDKYRTERSEKE